jgi:hypothetical protein
MSRSRRLGFAVVVAALVAGTGAGRAAGTLAQVCSGVKLKTAGKVAGVALGCHAKAAKQGAAVDGDCLAKADAKLSAGFAKAEARGGCLTTDDADDVGAILDSSVDAFVAALRPAMTANRCAALKLKATGKKAKTKLGCHGKAAHRGDGVDASCLAKAEARFAAAFAAAESDPTCFTMHDAGDVEDRVDELVADVVAALPSDTTTTGASSTTTSSTASSTTTTGAPVCGNGVREGSEQCDGTPTGSLCGDRFGCFPAGDPRECTCCTRTGETGQLTFDPNLDVCCDGSQPQPGGPNHYLCPGTCGVSGFPACGGSCQTGLVCVPVIFNGMQLCGCTSPEPCAGTCTGDPACCTGAVCSTPGEVCDGSTCSCVVP